MASIQITPIASFVGSALATQDDGKVLQVGTVWAGGRSNIALVRYNTDGSRDTIFSGINTATISPGTNYVGTSVSLTDDGFILVGGYSSNDTTHIAGPALFRFNPDGSLDGSFYNGGPTDLGHNGYATSIAIQPDGKTLVAGSYSNIILVYGTGQSMPTQFGVDRHNPDGTLDTSFGVNGRAVTGVGMSYGQDQCNGITVQSDGKFILVGQSPTTDSLTQFTLIRYLANGTLDNSFSNDGIATTRFGSVWDGATSVTVDSHNNILVAGHSYQGNNYDFALARFAPDGTLDTNFSSDGRVTTNLGLSDGSNAFATSVAVDSSDNVLVAGVCYVGLGWDAQGALLPTAHYAFGIARYTSAGVLDTDFNENGHVIVDIPTGNGGGQGSTVSISIQGDGKILLSGTHVRADGTSDFAAIRLNANGSVDETFILGSNSADTLYGSDASDFIIGNAANDLLIGGYGSDELVGGSGDDTLNGGDGIDCADYSSAVNGVNVNLKTGNANGIGTSGLTETGVDSLIGIEEACGGFGNDILTASNSGSHLDGGAGKDKSYAGDGNDHIDGGVGNDLIEAGSGKGSDSYIGGRGVDVISFRASDVSVIVNLAGVSAITNKGEASLGGIENVFGSDFDDTLTGDEINNVISGEGGNDTLDGGGGVDKLMGGWGYDVYIVDSTTDTIIEDANNGIDEVRSSVTYTRLERNVENLRLMGSASINGTGNSLNNILTGNDGANILDGGAGNDNLTGGAGADTLYGGTGSDSLYGGEGNDLLDGGTGTDCMVGGSGDDIYVVDSTGDYINELVGENGGADSVLSSTSFSLVKSTSPDDIKAISGDVENLTLVGKRAINGTGNTLDNVLIGNSAANNLNGGAGNDTLTGGSGNDTLIGGEGADVYVFSGVTLPSNGTDAITFIAAEDTLQFSLLNVNAVKIGEALLTRGTININNIVIGTHAVAADSNDYFLYDTFTGQLLFDADGNGGGGAAAVVLATLVGHPTITLDDLVLL